MLLISSNCRRIVQDSGIILVRESHQIYRFLVNSSGHFSYNCVFLRYSLISISDRHYLIVGFIPQSNLLSANLLFLLFLLLSSLVVRGGILLLSLLLLWSWILNRHVVIVIVSVMYGLVTLRCRCLLFSLLVLSVLLGAFWLMYWTLFVFMGVLFCPNCCLFIYFK